LTARRLAPAALARAALMAGLWWVVAEGRGPGGATGLVLAAATVAGATALSLGLAPPGRAGVRPLAIPRFVAVFLAASVAGGLDVARRALLPGGRVRPGWVVHTVRLPPGPARAIFLTTISLQPGTLVSEDRGSEILVHALDTELGVAASLRRTEAEVARLFGVALEP
jgi:multicomponent Na+:H+ antiporter subunit E